MRSRVPRKNFLALVRSESGRIGGAKVRPRGFLAFFLASVPLRPRESAFGRNLLLGGIAAPRRTWAGRGVGSPFSFSDLANLAPFGALLGPRGHRTPAYDLAGTRKAALLGRRGRSAAGTAERGTAALSFCCDIQRSSTCGRSAPRGRGSVNPAKGL